MISINDIQAVRAAAAYTRDGHKTGRVGDVYVDDLSGQPAWVTITAGIFGTKTLFAPLEGATLDGDRLVLAYDSGVIAGAPHIADSGHINDVEQQALIDYFTKNQANAPVSAQAPEPDAVSAAQDVAAAPGIPAADFASDDTVVAPPGTFEAPGSDQFGTGEAAAVVDATQLDPVVLADDGAEHGAEAASEADGDAPSAAETTLSTTIETDGPFAIGEAVVVGQDGVTEVDFAGPVSDDVATGEESGQSDHADHADHGDAASEGADVIAAEAELGASGDGSPAIAEATDIDPEAAADDASAQAGADDASAQAEDPDDPFSISAPVIAPVAAAAAVGVAVASSEAADTDAESPAHDLAEAADAGEAEAHGDDQESWQAESVDADADSSGSDDWGQDDSGSDADSSAEVSGSEEDSPADDSGSEEDSSADDSGEAAADGGSDADPHLPVSGSAAAPASDDTSAQVAHSGRFRMHLGHTRETIYRDADGNILYSVVHTYDEIFDNGDGS